MVVDEEGGAKQARRSQARADRWHVLPYPARRDTSTGRRVVDKGEMSVGMRAVVQAGIRHAIAGILAEHEAG